MILPLITKVQKERLPEKCIYIHNPTPWDYGAPYYLKDNIDIENLTIQIENTTVEVWNPNDHDHRPELFKLETMENISSITIKDWFENPPKHKFDDTWEDAQWMFFLRLRENINQEDILFLEVDQYKQIKVSELHKQDMLYDWYDFYTKRILIKEQEKELVERFNITLKGMLIVFRNPGDQAICNLSRYFGLMKK